MKTQLEIQADFNAYVRQENPLVNPNVKGTDWYVYGLALGGIDAQVYQDIQGLQLAIYTQLSSGVFLDYRKFSLGLPPRTGESFAMVTAANSVLPGQAYFFESGTEFTSSFNGSTYTLINDVTMSTTVPTTFSLQSTTSGVGYQLPVGAALTNSEIPSVSILVTASTDGQAAQTDGQVRQECLQEQQNPPGGGRSQQYIDWAQASDSNITVPYAIVIPFFFSNSDRVGVFVLSGGSDYDNILVNTLPYTRTATPATILAADTYISTNKPVQGRVLVKSVSTYMIPNAITINVVLPEGTTLNTVTTNIDGNSITVENLIFQEFRRGIITYPFQGTIIGTSAYLMLSQIQQTMDVGLSIRGGIYQQLLIDREILVDGIVQNIGVPYRTLDADLNLQCVYDIDQSQVTINQV